MWSWFSFQGGCFSNCNSRLMITLNFQSFASHLERNESTVAKFKNGFWMWVECFCIFQHLLFKWNFRAMKTRSSVKHFLWQFKQRIMGEIQYLIDIHFSRVHFFCKVNKAHKVMNMRKEEVPLTIFIPQKKVLRFALKLDFFGTLWQNHNFCRKNP